MGLDIIAISQLKYSDDQSESNLTSVYCTIADGFEERMKGMGEGYWDSTEYSETHSFRAGSYSGYSAWRDWLGKTFLEENADSIWKNYEEMEKDHLPFIELINFSDCEGTIGPNVSMKLYEDFYRYSSEITKIRKIDSAGSDISWYTEQYDNWMRAFFLGAQKGAVIFG